MPHQLYSLSWQSEGDSLPEDHNVTNEQDQVKPEPRDEVNTNSYLPLTEPVNIQPTPNQIVIEPLDVKDDPDGQPQK